MDQTVEDILKQLNDLPSETVTDVEDIPDQTPEADYETEVQWQQRPN